MVLSSYYKDFPNYNRMKMVDIEESYGVNKLKYVKDEPDRYEDKLRFHSRLRLMVECLLVN